MKGCTGQYSQVVPNTGVFGWTVPATVDDLLLYRVFLRNNVTLLETTSGTFTVNHYLRDVPTRCV